MDADKNNNPDLGNANLPPDLTPQQIDVFELLRDLSTEREKFHHWYLGAIQVLVSKSPDKIAQAANSIRELCEKLATRMNVAESQSPLPPLKTLLQDFPGVKASAYPFRLIVGGDDVLKIMQFLGETLDYKNFKDTVNSTPDQRDKHAVYGQVWHLLLDKFGGYGKNVSERQN